MPHDEHDRTGKNSVEKRHTIAPKQKIPNEPISPPNPSEFSRLPPSKQTDSRTRFQGLPTRRHNPAC
jgi:hypothetical protein